MEILIIKLGALGDVLRTTCILKGLKEKYPECSIDWVTGKEAVDLLIDNIYIENLTTLKNVERIRAKSYDMVVCLEDDKDACKLATEVNKKKLVGSYLNEDGEVRYTSAAAQWFDMGLSSRFGKARADELKKQNQKSYQQHLSEMLEVKVYDYVFSVGMDEKKFAKKFAERHKINGYVIGLNTGAGSRWELKKLGTERTIELAKRLKGMGTIIIFGGPDEVESNKKILQEVEGAIDAGCDNSLKRYAALMELCNMVVCSDSLALHMALSLKKKVVAFFGPTSAAEIEMYGRGVKIIPDSPCYCCYKKRAEEGVECMDKIRMDDIISAVMALKV